MKHIKFAALLLFAAAQMVYAQINADTVKPETDSTLNDSVVKAEMPRLSDLLSKERLGKNAPEDMESGLIFYPPLESFPLLSDNKLPEGDYSGFAASFTKLMQQGYKEHTKYDLRKMSDYLGISKKLAAIILALISAL
jgi:hypothetical protein